MNSRDLLEAMDQIDEEILEKTAPKGADGGKKKGILKRFWPLIGVASLAACLVIVWLIVKNPPATKAEAADWDISQLTPEELQLPTDQLIDVILKKDCLWQSHIQSGSGVWGPFEEWREKLNGIRELEKRDDAGWTLYLKMMEYYVMYTVTPGHLKVKDEASWYRLRAIQTLLQQETFLSQLDQDIAESAMGLIRTREEGDTAYMAGRVYELKEFAKPSRWKFEAWYVVTAPMSEEMREKVLSVYSEEDCARAIKIYGFEKAPQSGSWIERYIIPFTENGRIVSYVSVDHWNNGNITLQELKRETDPDMIIFDMLEAMSSLSSEAAPMRIVSDHNAAMFFIVGDTAYTYTGIPKHFVGRSLSGLSEVQHAAEDQVICIH